MFQELFIQNFQSHKKVTLNFSKGINSIVGISDSGKTALLRALYWAIHNRPLLGEKNADVSDWNKDDKYEPIKSTFVKVTTDKGVIERRYGFIKVDDKKKKFNGYILNNNLDNRLEAIGTSVPDIVTKMFNLDEVNFQGQFDPSFLLSSSSGEVARFFNSTIRLDLIDKILSNADSKRLETLKEKRRLEIELNDINKEIAKFDWLDNAEKLVNKIVVLDDRIEESESEYEKLSNLLDEYLESINIIDSQEAILSAVPIIEKINSIQESLERKIEKYERLQNLYSEWLEQNSIIGMADFSIAEELIDKIEVLNDKIVGKEEKYSELEESLDYWKIACDDVKRYAKEVIELEKQLPERCPTCGKKLSEDKCK
jgi:DNA repair exonuclease SbcCD ATPase subunit